ncbi:MAG: ATP-binding protein [Bacteroidetes bacterium]|nr:MAG: ATP-binding protein [Bacteroidota bacterium]
MKEKVLFCWSGGKDSALCLHKVLQADKYEVVALLTTVNEHYKRISMHGVREELLDEQAKSIGIPLEKMYVGKESTNEEYEENMGVILEKYKAKGITQVVFGDIFLEDLKQWRENNLKKVELSGLFPLWKMDTNELINEFIESGFKTITCCINDGYLGEDMVGRVIDASFVTDLPDSVDPCGENGEFHSFAFDGPIFKQKIEFEIGEIVYKPLEIKTTDDDNVCKGVGNTKGFWFCDLVPN